MQTVIAYVATSSGGDESSIAAAIAAGCAQVGRFMTALRLQAAGRPLTIDGKRTDGTYEFDAAVPLSKAPEREVPAASVVTRLRIPWPGRLPQNFEGSGPALQSIRPAGKRGR